MVGARELSEKLPYSVQHRFMKVMLGLQEVIKKLIIKLQNLIVAMFKLFAKKKTPVTEVDTGDAS